MLMRTVVVALILFAAPCAAQRAADPGSWWGPGVAAAIDRAGDRAVLWRGMLARVPQAQRAGAAFLVTHMPRRDLVGLDPEFVLENIALAYAARGAVPWGAELPDELFFNDVLPYAHVTEARHSWRADFFARFLPVVSECATPGEAATKLNATIFAELGVGYSTGRKRADQSPAESIEQGKASCTGLSILLGDACRAVGVPARLAGIPSWVGKPGNHTWLEVWDDGAWHFTGAAEPDARGLDHAWFAGDARLAQRDSREHAIYAASWRHTGALFPLVWQPRQDYVYAVNATDRYTGAVRGPARDPSLARLMVAVTERGEGQRVAVPVRVVQRGGAGGEHLGTSRDEGADTNDYLTFEVPRGGSYEVWLWRGSGWARGATVELGGDAQRIVRLQAASAADAELAAALVRWFAADPKARPQSAFTAAQQARLRAEPEAVRALAWSAYQAAPMHAAARADFDAGRVRWRDHESPYTIKHVGKRPAGGWALFIAMHGGGGVPARVNDSQWRHMQRYYRDHPEVGGYAYVALRAPNDRWNGFYDDTISAVVEQLVASLLLFGEVDPDKVFLMGYSHGGYGAFVIGTKIPHRFAAVHSSAAAPTPGETAAENLRTTPFTYMVGEKDTAHGRIARARSFETKITELRAGREDTYPVTFEYRAGYGHGGLPDRDKVASMYPRVRNPTPTSVTWLMTDDVLRDAFWLHVPAPASGARVDAALEDQTVTVDASGVQRLTLWLDHRLVDLAQPLHVVANGAARTVQLQPRLEDLCQSLLERRDPALACAARVDLDLPAAAK